MSDQKNPGHNSKRDFLKNPVEHIDITSFDSRTIISSNESSIIFVNDSYPMYCTLTVNGSESIFFIVYLPSSSVAAPFDVPSIITFAPMSGFLLLESFTIPDIP